MVVALFIDSGTMTGDFNRWAKKQKGIANRYVYRISNGKYDCDGIRWISRCLG